MKHAARLLAFLLIASPAVAAQPPAKRAAQTPGAAEFSLVAVGDLIISRPLSMLRNPGAFPFSQSFSNVIGLLSQSDVTYGNMETSIFDSRGFAGYPYSWDGDWMLTALPSVPRDLRKMGFDIVSRANNHALDWGVDGMRATISNLGNAGLASAGTGETVSDAAKAGVFSSARGNVALVSMVSTFRPTTNALPPVTATAPYGRPGANGLAVTQTAVVDVDTYAKLSAIACAFRSPCSSGAPLDFFGEQVRTAGSNETPFTYVYTVDQSDQSRITQAVASAKKAARYVLASIHSHEPLTDEAPPATWQDPAGFLRPLAHAMIDAGADAFIVTGIHHVAGLEVYKGKPVFYGLGNFFWNDIQEPLSAELYESIGNRRLLREVFEYPQRTTDSDLSNILNANSTFATAGHASLNRTFQTVLTQTAYDDSTGQVKLIKLYPIDLGYGEKLTQSGVPRQAAPTIANMVLDRIIALSSGGNVSIVKSTENGYVIGLAVPLSASPSN